MRLILVRHGQTAWNQDRRIQGCRSDVELSREGEEQAERIASWLARRKVDAIYSSPLRRAVDTALATARACRVEIRIVSGLKEIDAGELEGLYADKLGKEHGGFWREWRRGNPAQPLPGGESLEEVRTRSWVEVEQIAEKHTGETVVVVGHFFTNLVVICQAIGISLATTAHLRQDPAATSILEISRQGNSLHLFNDTCHLQDH